MGFSLSLTPAFAAQPLGVVVLAYHARLGSATASHGATVFAGDLLATDSAGILRVRVGSVQIYLRENSRATIDQTEGGVSARLEGGTLGFSSSGGVVAAVRARGIEILPDTSQPTHGEVAWLSPTEFLVTSFRGPLRVSAGGDFRTVPEATSYRLVLSSEQQEIAGVGAHQAGRVWLGYLVAGLIVATAVTLPLLKNVVSPSIP